jgi:hypothetical protein
MCTFEYFDIFVNINSLLSVVHNAQYCEMIVINYFDPFDGFIQAIHVFTLPNFYTPKL